MQESYPQIAYTLNNIKNWEKDRLTIPREIEQIKNERQAYQCEVDSLQLQLSCLQTESIVPLEGKIVRLKSRLDALSLPPVILQIKQEVDSYEAELTALRLQMNTLSQRLHLLDSEQRQIRGHITRIELDASINVLSMEVQQHNEQILFKQKKLFALQESSSCVRETLNRAGCQYAYAIDSFGMMMQHQPYTHYHDDTFRPQAHSLGSVRTNSLGLIEVSHVSLFQPDLCGLESEQQRIFYDIFSLQNSISQQQLRADAAATRLRILQSQMVSLRVHGISMATLPTLKSDLAFNEHSRNQCAAEIQVLENEIARHSQALKSRTQKIYELKSRCSEGQQHAGEFSTEIDSVVLQGELDRSAYLKRDLQKSKQSFETAISEMKKTIVLASTSIKRKTEFQARLRGDTFFHKFCDMPAELCEDLYTRLTNTLTEYELKYPAGQCQKVRLFLAETQVMLHKISAMPATNAEDFRHQYSQMCGMLRVSCRTVEALAPSSPVEMVRSLFSLHPLDAEDSIQAFEALQALYPNDFRRMTVEELERAEVSEHVHAMNVLNDRLDDLSDYKTEEWQMLRKQSQALIAVIHSEKASAKMMGSPGFDLKFYTTLLEKSAELVATPANLECRERFQQLIPHISHGCASVAKKVAGILFMLLGAATVIAGVGLASLSVGFANPLTLGCIAGGSAFVLLGVGLFGRGFQRGLAKRSTHVMTAACMISDNPSAAVVLPSCPPMDEPPPYSYPIRTTG